jgi:hypothetical protein
MPEGAVYVGRPSRWGNPFVIGEEYLFGDRDHLGPGPLVDWPMPTWREPGTYPNGIVVVRLEHVEVGIVWYRHFISQPAFARHLAPLQGKDLVCWCPLEDETGRRVPCHADVLLELANR